MWCGVVGAGLGGPARRAGRLESARVPFRPAMGGAKRAKLGYIHPGIRNLEGVWRPMTRLPAAKRREQLLDTAVLLFAERGFAGATTSELARAAGVTAPLIYRPSRSAKDLFIAAIDRPRALTLTPCELYDT